MAPNDHDRTRGPQRSAFADAWPRKASTALTEFPDAYAEAGGVDARCNLTDAGRRTIDNANTIIARDSLTVRIAPIAFDDFTSRGE